MFKVCFFRSLHDMMIMNFRKGRNDMTHAHITSWLITIVLFFVAVSLLRSGSSKAKIVQMVLRLFYILTIITGLLLLHSIASISILYIVKTIAGLWLIGAMEMVLISMKKEKSAKAAWIQWIIAFALALFLGLSLPLGFDVF
ncbi:hypothetical protein B4168_3036 [Anoxybacillus flavithermus]|nr:hypothetical protein B4168_3036 [Anoxybacillus flavithermus]OAO86324.1 hypothetical protein GT23_2217 [Parageobacillus thermoglucosidasius]